MLVENRECTSVMYDVKSGDCRSRKYVGTCTNTLPLLNSSSGAPIERAKGGYVREIAYGAAQRQAHGFAHLLGHQLALVHDGVRGQRADVGMLVAIALPVPLVLNQLPQDVELHPSKPPQ